MKMKNEEKRRKRCLIFAILAMCLPAFLTSHASAQIPDLYRSYGISEKSYCEKEKAVRSRSGLVTYLTNCIKKRKRYIKVDTSALRISKSGIDQAMRQAIGKAAGKGISAREYYRNAISQPCVCYDEEKGLVKYYEVIVEYESPKEKRYLEKRSRQITSGIKRKTDYEKALYLSRWIVKNIEYDYTYQSRTTYTTLRTGKGVCMGYALLFQRLAMEAGIKSYVVTGYVDKMPHAWNLVKAGSRYYHLDVCWMDGKYTDGNSFINYDYFLFGSDFCRRCRTIDKETRRLTGKVQISRSAYGKR